MLGQAQFELYTPPWNGGSGGAPWALRREQSFLRRIQSTIIPIKTEPTMIRVSPVKATVKSTLESAAADVPDSPGYNVVLACSDFNEQNFSVENASKLEVDPEGQAHPPNELNEPPASKHAALMAVVSDDLIFTGWVAFIIANAQPAQSLREGHGGD